MPTCKCDEKFTDSIESVKFVEQLAFQGTHIKLFLRLFNSLFDIRKNVGSSVEGHNLSV